MLSRTPPRSLAEMGDDEIVKPEDVAKWLGCSVRTIWRAGLPYIEISPRVRRFRAGDVRRWLAARVRVA